MWKGNWQNGVRRGAPKPAIDTMPNTSDARMEESRARQRSRSPPGALCSSTWPHARGVHHRLLKSSTALASACRYHLRAFQGLQEHHRPTRSRTSRSNMMAISAHMELGGRVWSQGFKPLFSLLLQTKVSPTVYHPPLGGSSADSRSLHEAPKPLKNFLCCVTRCKWRCPRPPSTPTHAR